MIFVIDNYDSFTYNLVQYLGELGQELAIHRNDRISVDQIEQMQPDRIVISPGPCTPDQAGISVDVVRHFAGKLPLLGVCLGHQSIAQAFGGHIIRAAEPVHGKTSDITHDDRSIFSGIPSPFTATRYHSLIVEEATLPDCLEVTAWLEDDTVMGLRHREHPHLQGVQFHPESVLTEAGHNLLANFLRLAEGRIQHC